MLNGAIMRPIQYPVEALSTLLRRQKIATLAELMAALGTEARRTVFRKLNELSYRTSYSHRGRYYTLDRIAQFDEWGLWSYRDAWFSIHGTLLSTAAALVERAHGGYFAEELDHLLHVGTQDALRKLVADLRLRRARLGGQFLYCAADAERRRQQLSLLAPGPARRAQRCGTPAGRVPPARGAEGCHRPVLQPARREAAKAVRRA